MARGRIEPRIDRDFWWDLGVILGGGEGGGVLFGGWGGGGDSIQRGWGVGAGDRVTGVVPAGFGPWLGWMAAGAPPTRRRSCPRRSSSSRSVSFLLIRSVLDPPQPVPVVMSCCFFICL